MPRRIALATFLAVAAGAAWIGCGGPEPGGRVLVLGLDGLDPRAVDLLMAEGRLPHFARLRQQGAYGRLVSEKPLLSPILWTTIATGKPPSEHGIGHFVAIDPATGGELPVTSRMRRAKALWNIASEADRRVAVVGWWATWPPEAVRGSVVSDHTAYHFLFADALTGGTAAEPKTFPAELAERIRPLLRRPGDLTAADLAPFVRLPADEPEARPFDFADDLAHFRWALSTAQSYGAIGLDLWRRERPDLGLVYVEGTDSTSHLFGHLFRAEGLSGELAGQQQRYGQAVEAMYRFADRLVGDYLDELDDRSTLLVLSDHGFDLGTLHDDPSRTRDLRRVSERYHNPEGILYLYGRGVKRHARLERPRLYDVAPTVLALLGLPAGRDMPGRVLDEGLTLARVPERVATHEERTGAMGTAETAERAGGAPAASDPTADPAILARLKSLGYLGEGRPEGGAVETSPEGDRNLAAILFEAGRYEEAAAAYRRLAAAAPEDPALLTSLAGALGALGRYGEALAAIEKAIALDPLNVEAYHNRAVIHERQGEGEEAIADYRAALRYNPDYEPSRAALARLAGPDAFALPRSAAEERALALAGEAARAARRGDYPAALARLDEAEKLAPDLALLYQYRSNVAYLAGDTAAAIAALERALALEPDNALYRENLRRLRGR